MLATAAQLFAGRGYPSASVADLARSLGVSKALLYHYYRDKEQLLFDIVNRYLDGLLALVADVRAQDLPADEHLRTLILRLMHAYEHSASHHRVLVQDVKYLSAPHRTRVRAKQRRVVEAFARAVAAVAPGLDHGELLKPVTMVLFGMMNWTFTWLRENGALSYADLAPVVAGIFLGGVRQIKAPRSVRPKNDAHSAARRVREQNDSGGSRARLVESRGI
ncbi:MAG: TetR/AcrR family transcriptional regulator [Gemmatimonadota bacterium]